MTHRKESLKSHNKSVTYYLNDPLHYSNLLIEGWWMMNKENHGRAPGVILSNGPYWRELRRFLLRNLRDFGFGKSSMEELFHDEVGVNFTNIL
jgi:hypothetical protein